MLAADCPGTTSTTHQLSINQVAKRGTTGSNRITAAMSARGFKQAVARRLGHTIPQMQSVITRQWTGLRSAHTLHGAAVAQPAERASVKQISQWWEQQWHQQQQQQQGYQQQKRQQHEQEQKQPQWPVQHQHSVWLGQRPQSPKQQNLQQRAMSPSNQQGHQQPAAEAELRQSQQPAGQRTVTRDVRKTRRKSRPTIVSSAPAASSQPYSSPSSALAATSQPYGSPLSLEATSKFKSLLASGNRFKKMSTSSELMQQAQQLHDVQHAAPSQPSLVQRSTSPKQESAFQGVNQSHDAMSQHRKSSVSAHQDSTAPDLAAAAAAERSAAPSSLDMTEAQLPDWDNIDHLEWPAQLALRNEHAKVQMKNAANSSLPILHKFVILEGSEQVEVQPLWLLVHQEEPNGIARLYETVHNLSFGILDHIPAAVEPFCITDKGTFRFCKPQFSHGPWKGYLVGSVGVVAGHEDDVLWPNRLICGDRVIHNVRNAWDITKFLAEPTVEDIAGHHFNLRLLQADKGYKPMWVWCMLKSRWGEEAVSSYMQATRQLERYHAKRESERLQRMAKRALCHA